jgi:SAM-dependent methyltransferase
MVILCPLPVIRGRFGYLSAGVRPRRRSNGTFLKRGKSMSYDEVRAYYDSFGEREWMRLEDPDDGVVEFAITCHALATYLPPNARILDIGGGPGRYAIWLAQRGHRVVLADLSPELLSIARGKIERAGMETRIEQIVEADARNLSCWDDDSFDAVLSLGPFYHLTDVEERHCAATELCRVLRPEGLAYIALMPRYAFLRRTLAIPDERHHLAQEHFVVRLMEDGVFINDISGRFTHGYGVRPEEVEPFFQQFGFRTLTLLATESIVPDIQRVLIELAEDDRATYEAAFELVFSVASDPCILGMAMHLLYVGRLTQ